MALLFSESISLPDCYRRLITGLTRRIANNQDIDGQISNPQSTALWLQNLRDSLEGWAVDIEIDQGSLDLLNNSSLGNEIRALLRVIDNAVSQIPLDNIVSSDRLVRTQRIVARDALYTLQDSVESITDHLAKQHDVGALEPPDLRILTTHDTLRDRKSSPDSDQYLGSVEAQATNSEHSSHRLTSQQHGQPRRDLGTEQIEETVELFAVCNRIKGETQAKDHPDRLSLQHNLAVTYLADRQARASVKLFEEVVRVREDTLEKAHPARLMSQRWLGQAYLMNGQADKAVKQLERVVQAEEGVLAENDPDLWTSYHWLSRAYRASGQTDRAYQLERLIVQRISNVPVERDDSTTSRPDEPKQ